MVISKQIINVVWGFSSFIRFLFCGYLISANTPFSSRRVPQGRANVPTVDEKCGCATSGSAFC